MNFKNRLYLILIIFTLVSVLIIIFLVYPLFLDIKNISKEILSNKEESAFLQDQSQEFDSFKNKLNRYEPDLHSMEQLFINPKDPVTFIEFLESTSSDSNVELMINLVKNTAKDSLDNPQVSYFQVDAKGSFQNILLFFQKIEKGPYLLKINKVSMSASEKTNQSSESTNLVEAVFVIQPIK